MIKLEKELNRNFKSKSKNLLFLNYAPQMEILKKADIFLTHSGAGSVFESIFYTTPMLLFPLNDKWDQNGVAARVVHHGMGIKAELNDPKIKISEAIQTILSQDKYKENVLKFSERFQENYGDSFLEKKISTELLVQ